MPIDFNAAQQLIQSRGVQPPAGVQPGTPQYQQWATEWLQGAANSGDPEAVQAAGGSAGAPEAAGYGEGDAYMEWQGAAEPEEWMGKRNPTPPELRKWANYEKQKYGAGQGGQDEDYMRFGDRVLGSQISQGWDTAAGGWKSGWGTPGAGVPGQQGARGGGGFGGGGGRGGRGGSLGNLMGAGAAPTLELPEFVAPTAEQAMAEPGYQFALKQGQDALESSAAARGTLRTGGTLKDLMGYGQQMGAQQYGNVYNRALQDYMTNTGATQAEFAPQMQAWQTQYGGNLQNMLQGNQLGYNRWATQYGGNLSKHLQREGNIYGLLNQPMPAWPGGY